MLNSVFAQVCLEFFVWILKAIAEKLIKMTPYCQWLKYVPGTVVSGNISFMWIFTGGFSVRRHWLVENCDFFNAVSVCYLWKL